MKKICKICKQYRYFIAISIALILLAFPYVKAEYLTARYGETFVGLEHETGMLQDSKYCKVIEYSDGHAKVFYVSDSGDLLHFVKDKNGEWHLDYWETVWATHGSADGFMWPYYR